MKKSRIALVAALAAASALAMSGCASGSGGGGGVPASAKQTISFSGSDDPSTYTAVIGAFEKKYPNITVKYTQIPQSDFDTTILQRLNAKDKSIDVFTVDQPTVAELAASGDLVDLSSLKSEAKAAFPPDQYSVDFYKGKMWALPVWTSTGLLFYNKEALQKAGVPFPSSNPADPLTWEQVATEGAQVQARGGAESGLLFEDNVYYNLQPLAESLGGGSGVTGSDGLGIDVTNAGWQKAMDWYAKTYSSGLSPRGVSDLQTDQYFADGKVAFFVTGPWDVSGFGSGATVDWGVAPMPYFQGGKDVTPTGSWSWGINPVSTHRAADLEFVKFASLNPAGNLDTVKTTSIIPSNTKAAASYLPQLEKQAGTHAPGVAAIITYANKHTAVARPTTVGYVQFEGLMDKAFSDIADGANVRSRLAEAQSQVIQAWKNLK